VKRPSNNSFLSLRAFSIPVIASRRRGNLHEKGFTLVEMLVVISLIAIVVGGAAVSIASILKSTDISNAQTIALRQVQNVGFWVTRDVLMAKEPATLGAGSGFPLSLVYDDWDEGSGTFVERTVEYVFDGDELHRKLDGASPGTLIAEYIDVDSTSFDVDPDDENRYILIVRASFSEVFAEASVERTYDISPRPDS